MNIVRSLKQIAEAEMMAGVSEVYVEENGIPPEFTAKSFSETDALASIGKKVSVCELCGLSKTRTNTVFGEGNCKSGLMFVGEAPGRDEDLEGKPFVGKAGKLLTDIIEAIGLKREDVYIANILKCRPPENRNPLPEEIEKCSSYLKSQIRALNPKVICALGKFAAQTLLSTGIPISELRGKFHDYNGVKLMPTYHPAYLLRNPASKKEVWRDMKAVASELGIKIPARGKEKK